MKDNSYWHVDDAANELLDLALEELRTKENGGDFLNYVSKAKDLYELLNESDKDEMEFETQKEKIKIEREKNVDQIQLEVDKLKLTPGKITFEMAKILVPLLISVGAYNIFQVRVCHLETMGKVMSFAGRELKLPKFFADRK